MEYALVVVDIPFKKGECKIASNLTFCVYKRNKHLFVSKNFGIKE